MNAHLNEDPSPEAVTETLRDTYGMTTTALRADMRAAGESIAKDQQRFVECLNRMAKRGTIEKSWFGRGHSCMWRLP